MKLKYKERFCFWIVCLISLLDQCLTVDIGKLIAFKHLKINLLKSCLYTCIFLSITIFVLCQED